MSSDFNGAEPSGAEPSGAEPSGAAFADDLGDPLASIGQRIGARVLDWGGLLTVWFLLGAATSERQPDDTLVFQRWAVIVWMALVIVYEVGFVAWRGQTPGKILLHIKLVTLKDGRIPSLPAAITRVLPVAFAIALLGAFFPIAMVFIYFSAAFMKQNRGILDRMSGTAVIQTRH